QRKLNEEVNDDLAVKREEGFIRCSQDDFVDGVAMRQKRKLNEEVNDNMAVKREEGFICCSRIKLDHGEYRKKKIKPVDYDKCTEELGDSSRVRKRLQLR
ncbi:unnamed protein product, partial [Porites evermanni]